MRLAYLGAAMKYAQRLLAPEGFGTSHGTITIYSAPKPVLRHIEWTIGNVLGNPFSLNWKVHRLSPSTFWTEANWSGPRGVASQIASELKGWHYLNFEIHETAANGSDGSLFMYTPELGIFYANVGPHGDVMINENQIQSIIRENISEVDVIEKLERTIGKPWDNQLEPFRRATKDIPADEDVRLSV